MSSDEEGQVMNSGAEADANTGSGANTDGVDKADADANAVSDANSGHWAPDAKDAA